MLPALQSVPFGHVKASVGTPRQPGQVYGAVLSSALVESMACTRVLREKVSSDGCCPALRGK